MKVLDNKYQKKQGDFIYRYARDADFDEMRGVFVPVRCGGACLRFIQQPNGNFAIMGFYALPPFEVYTPGKAIGGTQRRTMAVYDAWKWNHCAPVWVKLFGDYKKASFVEVLERHKNLLPSDFSPEISEHIASFKEFLDTAREIVESLNSKVHVNIIPETKEVYAGRS